MRSSRARRCQERVSALACCRTMLRGGRGVQVTVSLNFWFKPNPKSRFRPTSMFLSSDDYVDFCKKKQKIV